MKKNLSHIVKISLAFSMSLIAFLLLSEKEQETCCKLKKENDKVMFFQEIAQIAKQGNQTQCCLPTEHKPLAGSVLSIHSSVGPYFLTNLENDPQAFLSNLFANNKANGLIILKDFTLDILSKRYHQYIFWLCQLRL
ncbi:hypothetical protein MY04_4820 [Flammeovirga sp. MY04]|uniref:hypothetical protein n=1 Tax=Flammeovirga sp. MY04 TaxID=1191459 RepID=UPI00080643C7|nr:hypothetical protein [Flammeovirga sp. MY04]ANQ52155.1 hypothetical protein MY04_4820 [Flammeovirga sp. MY04]